MKKKFTIRTSLALNVIGAIVLLLSLFGLITSCIGVVSFSNSLKREYTTTTYHMADTVVTIVNGDNLDAYLSGEEMEEYETIEQTLYSFCRRLNVSLIYVIQVDRSDYGRFVSIFNLVNNSVDDSSYSKWEIGYQRDATNAEYSRKYRALYEKESSCETIFRYNPPDGLHPHITTMVPVRDSSGEVKAILCMQRPIRELKAARRPYLITIAVSTALLAALVSVFAALFLRKQFVVPIRRISDESARFAREGTKGEELGEVSRYKEISALAASVDKMETDMVNYIENLTAITAEKERIGVELDLAGRIQESAVPGSFPAFPDRKDFDIYGVMDPARQVGGDFYNFFLIDEDHLALVIGDVSGKGVPASLFMMVTTILIGDRTRMGGTPAEILTYVNQNLCEHNRAEMFVTVWLGILELSTGRLTAANAGHEYPAVKNPEGCFELLKDKHGFVLGGMEGIRYKEYELKLEPGSRLFVYTDGVPEAMDPEGSLFGTERMLDALNREPAASPEQILRNVRSAVDGFVKDAEQFDDLTMLCLELK